MAMRRSFDLALASRFFTSATFRQRLVLECTTPGPRVLLPSAVSRSALSTSPGSRLPEGPSKVPRRLGRAVHSPCKEERAVSRLSCPSSRGGHTPVCRSCESKSSSVQSQTPQGSKARLQAPKSLNNQRLFFLWQWFHRSYAFALCFVMPLYACSAAALAKNCLKAA